MSSNVNQTTLPGADQPLVLGQAVVVVIPLLTTVTTLLLGLRFFYKQKHKRPWSWDDHLLIAAYITYIISLVCLLIAGVRRDPKRTERENFNQGIHIMSAGSGFNMLTLILTKVSIIYTLLRITTNTQTVWHRYFLWGVIFLTVMIVGSSGITFCIETWWTTLDMDCVKNDSLWQWGIFAGVWSTGTDFLIAAFSWVIIWKLNMRMSEKIGIGLVLSTGIIAGTIAAIRLYQMIDFCAGIDPTKEVDDGILTKQYITLVLWSFVEAAATAMGSTAGAVRMMMNEVSRRLGETGLVRRASRLWSTHPGLPVRSTPTPAPDSPTEPVSPPAPAQNPRPTRKLFKGFRVLWLRLSSQTSVSAGVELAPISQGPSRSRAAAGN
ncbi:hypothetical protein QBC38DRAFT_503645 [Podospora fimiseda]|uniref:Rhodopsin domain-containing protein n=1 Tax=Podospora fimiseda TaxID=252190 RepID=A0AAN6YP47_9PEZI|nr:hypothetical protein QBC38DRAFT_503645 [Podospora fimiseda]